MHPDKYTLPSGSSWTRLYRRADDEPPGRCERACGLAAQITEKDEAVLAYLTDITYVDLSEEAAPAKAGAPAAAAKAGEEEEDEDEEEEEDEEPHGFKLTFHFAANPFFPHATLVRPGEPAQVPPGACRGLAAAVAAHLDQAMGSAILTQTYNTRYPGCCGARLQPRMRLLLRSVVREACQLSGNRRCRGADKDVPHGGRRGGDAAEGGGHRHRVGVRQEPHRQGAPRAPPTAACAHRPHRPRHSASGRMRAARPDAPRYSQRRGCDPGAALP